MASVRFAVCLLIAAVVLAAPAPFVTRVAADEKTDGIVASVKGNLKDPAKPFTMLVRLTVKEDAAEKLEAAMAKAIAATCKEKGCISYELSRDPKNPTRYLMYERWRNLEALETHLQTKYITKLLAELPDLLSGAPEIQVLLPVGD